ncbi:hypothetical protein PCNPT3_07440 [Psychromonas sp. CNPT3]|uniref:cell division protein ZapC domain-containing protein n=1 Tax=Psychromonas sp. CNPT3 TaxID=314282 RepID=UPI00006E85AB|nr:cell division protein ZapC domain-containing protein [Psychromonas sp. CNPT3]AGH81426.1 hypothetical protein PCNPT3_07440 [Psychromonas sp. CNPT3]
MIYLPQADWQWSIDPQDNSVSVLMGDDSVELVYQARMFISLPQKILSFSLEDVAHYTLLKEQFCAEQYTADQSCSIILHILAVTLFHKPIMPKSWQYQTCAIEALDIRSRECVYLTSDQEKVTAKYFVIDVDDKFALCLLVDTQHILTSRKTLRQGQIVKVSLDKITLIDDGDAG